MRKKQKGERIEGIKAIKKRRRNNRGKKRKRGSGRREGNEKREYKRKDKGKERENKTGMNIYHFYRTIQWYLTYSQRR